jgi:D-aminopeptidase
MIGMHAAAGTAGFLPHTLTSRLAALKVNGRPMAEVELFAASLAPCGIAPIFFSGCPVACAQARERIAGIHAFPIDKGMAPEDLDVHAWRRELAQAAAASLSSSHVNPYCPEGPFHAEIAIRDGAAAAAKMADPWGFKRTGNRIFIHTDDIHNLYRGLIRLCYLPPWAENSLPCSLTLYNFVGWLGRQWVRYQLKRMHRRPTASPVG